MLGAMGEGHPSGEEVALPQEVGLGAVLSNTYRIERLLGRGGMGLVFEASHLRVPKRVAVKVLLTAPDAEQLARFRQEAEVASRLGHPNIVDVIDFDTLPSGIPFLVMELLDGESLAARMQLGMIPQPEALAILRQIASALYAAHGAGVIHRDLKPENVFLCRREHDGAIVDDVKILDFGISKVFGSAVVRTREDLVLGTPKYMAPEQATAKHDEIDARTDQFSLAVIAYEMLAGSAPFEGDNATAVMFKIVYEPVAPLGPLAPDSSPAVVAAITRALAKAPADRFEDLSAFIEALTGKPLAIDRGSQRGVLRPIAPALTPRTELPTVQSGPPSERKAVQTVSGRGEPVAALGAPSATSSAAGVAVGSAASSAAGAGTPQVAGAPRSRWPVFLGIVTIGVIATALSISLLRRDHGGERAPADAGARQASVPLDAAHGDILTPPIDAAATIAMVPADAEVTPAADAAVAKRPPIAPGVAIPAEVLTEIRAAETALTAGNLDVAEAAAKRTFYSGRYARAYIVLVAIACAHHDVGAAHAWMRNLARSEWPAARAKCKALGFPLDNPT